MTVTTLLPERIQPMSEKFITPLLISFNLIMGVITLNDVQLVVAVLGAALMLAANLPKAILGVDFAVRYVRAGLRLPQKTVVAASNVPQSDNQEEPDADGNDDDFLKQKRTSQTG